MPLHLTHPIRIEKYSINKRQESGEGQGAYIMKNSSEQVRSSLPQRGEQQESKLPGPHEQTPSYRRFISAALQWSAALKNK